MVGTALSVHVSAPVYDGPTVPTFVQALTTPTPPLLKLTKWIDVSGVLSPNGKEVRLAIINRHATEAFFVPIRFGPAAEVSRTVKVYDVWSENLGDNNGFGMTKVKTVERTVEGWQGAKWECKRHSFQLLVFTLL